MLVFFRSSTSRSSDRDWIEIIRRAHDPQYSLIEPHITFVFPVEGISSDVAFKHAGAVASSTPPIAFRLSRAAAMRNSGGRGSHMMLLPGTGDDAMRALHRRLYAGALAPALNPAVPYVPHVTVAASACHEDAEAMAAAVGEVDIPGTLRAIVIPEYDGANVKELHRLTLGS